MTVRTNSGEVKGIIEVDAEINLAPFIRAASLLVDRLEAADTDSVHDAASLKIIETWIAAHCYSARDQRVAEEQKGRARARYQGKTGMYLDSTHYGQFAKMLDTTGFLADLGEKTATLEVIWGGTEYENAADYLP